MPLMLAAFLAQVVVISIIVMILKRILDQMLIDLAINLFEYWSPGKHPTGPVQIITHKRLSGRNVDGLRKALGKHSLTPDQAQYVIDKKILGGMIIRADNRIFDCSLKDRLRRARPGRTC